MGQASKDTKKGSVAFCRSGDIRERGSLGQTYSAPWAHFGFWLYLFFKLKYS